MSAIHDFIKQRKYLVWSTQHYDDLSEDVIVEAVLNYGDWKDVNELISILGIKRIAEIFKLGVEMPRCNYRPEVVNYFKLYFTKHAGMNFDKKSERCAFCGAHRQYQVQAAVQV